MCVGYAPYENDKLHTERVRVNACVYISTATVPVYHIVYMVYTVDWRRMFEMARITSPNP